MKSTSVQVLFSTLTMLCATQAFATQTCVMSIPGVPGESTSVPNGIDLFAFSWGLQNSSHPLATGGGAGRSRPQFNEFSVTKRLDKSSPLLMLGAAEGTHYATVTISCRKVGGEREQEYLKYVLTDALVSSYHSSGSSDIPTDSISLNFSRVEFTYHPQNPDGTLGHPVVACWDLRSERSCR